jgi:hypothetical protein
MTALPGQRVIVLMSPGFFVAPSMRESGEIIDRATKANIVINTIDARGLYVSSVYDVTTRSAGSPLRQAFNQRSSAPSFSLVHSAACAVTVPVIG